jgi:hypothetical protein
MTVELTRYEAEILIAVLAGAEGIFPAASPGLAEALGALRPWRSALVGAYIRTMVESPQAAAAVDPQAGVSTE